MRIQIESPFAGDTKRNIAYAKRALRYALDAGFAPMASHLLYTQVLDDTDPEQRKQGIDAALMYAEQADQIWVFEDYGITPGMAQAINAGANNDTPIVFMTIGKNKRFTSGEYDLEPCQLEHNNGGVSIQTNDLDAGTATVDGLAEATRLSLERQADRTMHAIREHWTDRIAGVLREMPSELKSSRGRVIGPRA